MRTLLLTCLLLIPDGLWAQQFFRHTAELGNISGNVTYLSHEAVNKNPNAFLIVTPLYSPNHNSEVAVFFDKNANQWAIVSLSLGAIKSGTQFNVLALTPVKGGPAFIHVATANNIAGSSTIIDREFINDNPGKVLFITRRSSENKSSASLFYSGGRWRIRNDNVSAMVKNTQFNVLALDPGSQLIDKTMFNVFSHQVSEANSFRHYSVMDNPLTNDQPEATLFFSSRKDFIPLINNLSAPKGVLYTKSFDGSYKWGIAHQNQTSINDPSVVQLFNILKVAEPIGEQIIPLPSHKGRTSYDLVTGGNAAHYPIKDSQLNFTLINDQQGIEVTCKLMNAVGTVWQSVLKPTYGFNFYEVNMTNLTHDYYTLEASFPDGKTKILRFRLNLK